MRIALPTWNGRISPVLDTAERLLVVETDGDGGQRGADVQLAHSDLHLRATDIAGLGLDLLVCGAVSRALEELLSVAGVPLRPWVAGDVKDVLDAAVSGKLDCPRFMMPGCCRGERRGRARRHGGHGNARRRDK
jgi:predicted Fe-Mo cluster-binding NifX family protein